MQQQETFTEDEELTTLFCRALHDYQAQDGSAISFKRGAIIEVLNKEPSGWWDGLLGNERGWFPSNYVEVIPEEVEQAPEEVEQAFLAAESPVAETSMQPSADASKDMSIIGRIDQEANEEWLKNEVLASSKATPTANKDVDPQMNDYWVPAVADGQIFYVNTRTGQRSRELPRYEDEYSSDSDYERSTSNLSMSPTKANRTFGHDGSSKPTRNTQAGFGIPRRTATPEPWVRRLHDDGNSYFYYNMVDGRIKWTRPEAPSNTPFQSPSSPPRKETVNSSRRLSIYADKSDIQSPHDSPARRPATNGASSPPSSETHTRPVVPANTLPDYTTAERIARSLQQIITSPQPEGVIELAAAADSVIRAVLDNIRMNGMIRRPEEDLKLNDLIYNVVVVVRNLLYALAVPTLQIPQNVLPREVRGLPLPPQSPLKPAQRKVTAALSRLILSAHAIQYDSGLLIGDTLSRIEFDAEGLRKDVNAFIVQLQKSKRHSKLYRHKHPKRLQGVFNAENVGPGLVGAGAAGRWKGFGWIPLDEELAVSRWALGFEVISQLGQASNKLDAQCHLFIRILQTYESSAKQVRSSGREFLSQTSSILNRISDIHVARHVDIDGLLQDGTGPYGRTIESAQWLVRKLEAVTQAVIDDTSVFFLTLQSAQEFDLPHHHEQRTRVRDHLVSLTSSVTATVHVLFDILDALLTLGHDQAEMSSGDYNGSIEWRMSRLSRLSLRPLSTYDAEDDPPMVNMPTARGRPPTKLSKAPDAFIPHDLSSDTSQTLGSLSESDSVTNTVPSEEEQGSRDIQDGEGSPGSTNDAVFSNPKSPAQDKGLTKLKKLLGDEYANQIAADFKPWYLRPNYNTKEILIDPDNTVKGGTLPALVERLTTHDPGDPSFNQAFLMTFKSFMSVEELFDLLVARFRLEPPLELKADELEDWKKQKQQLVQLRVINTFVTMLKDDGILEKEDLHILKPLRRFISSDEVSQVRAAKKVLTYIDRVARNDSSGPKITMQGAPPTPLYPKTAKKLKLTDIDPLELARQLTLKESNLYQKIKSMEWLQRAREQKAENMDNIANVIKMSNRIANWVAECVLSRQDARKRATTVKHLISVADRCRALNNFSSMIAITSGLNTPPIRRLKRTWELVNRPSMVQFTACEMAIESIKSITKYRQLMVQVDPPCVPFIGVFLSALQFIHDGNPDMLAGGLVNFRKRQKAFEVITDIKRWQAQSFNLQSVPSIQTYIEESLSQFNDTKAWSDHFWALSIELEPRERDDEKMARLLQESGFL